jgi:predicted transposase YbfD/YdcC
MRELYGRVNQGSWTDLGKEVAQLGTKGVACITDTRTVNGNTVVATRCFISSLKQDAREILRAVRAHWAVENTLRWSLDIAFREDES